MPRTLPRRRKNIRRKLSNTNKMKNHVRTRKLIKTIRQKLKNAQKN